MQDGKINKLQHLVIQTLQAESIIVYCWTRGLTIPAADIVKKQDCCNTCTYIDNSEAMRHDTTDNTEHETSFGYKTINKPCNRQSSPRNITMNDSFTSILLNIK